MKNLLSYALVLICGWLFVEVMVLLSGVPVSQYTKWKIYGLFVAIAVPLQLLYNRNKRKLEEKWAEAEKRRRQLKDKEEES